MISQSDTQPGLLTPDPALADVLRRYVELRRMTESIGACMNKLETQLLPLLAAHGVPKPGPSNPKVKFAVSMGKRRAVDLGLIRSRSGEETLLTYYGDREVPK